MQPTYTRRGAIALGVTVTTATAGCLGFITGDAPLTVAAEEATVSEEALAGTGYELERREPQTLNEEVSVGDQTREVEATNHIVVYRKEAELPAVGSIDAGVFAVVTTPVVEIVGQELNPVGELSNEEILDLVSGEYGSISSPEETGSSTVSMVQEETEVTAFRAEATVEGQTVDVIAHVGTARSADDFVIGVGIYPEQLRSEEESTILSLFEAIEHPVTITDSSDG